MNACVSGRKLFSAGRMLLIIFLVFMLVFGPVAGEVSAFMATRETPDKEHDLPKSPVNIVGSVASIFNSMFALSEDFPNDITIDSLSDSVYEFADEILHDQRLKEALINSMGGFSPQVGASDHSTITAIIIHVLRDTELREILGDVIASSLLLEEGSRERLFLEQITADAYELLQDDGDGSFKAFLRDALHGFLNDNRVADLTEDVLFILLGYTGDVLGRLESRGAFSEIPVLLDNFMNYMRGALEGTEMATVIHGLLDNIEEIPAVFREALREDKNFNMAMNNLSIVFWDSLIDPMFGDLEEAGVINDYLNMLTNPDCTLCGEGNPQSGCSECGGGVWGVFRGLMDNWLAGVEEECFSCGGLDLDCPYCPILTAMGSVLDDIANDIDLGIDHYSEGASEGGDCEVREQLADFLMHWADVLFAMFGHEEFSSLLLDPLTEFFTAGEGAYHLEDMAELLMINLSRALEVLLAEESPVAASIKENILEPVELIMEEARSALFVILREIVGNINMEEDISAAVEDFNGKLNNILSDVFPGYTPPSGEEEGAREEITVDSDIIDRLFENITTIKSYDRPTDKIKLHELPQDIAAYMASLCDDPECNCGRIKAEKIAYDLSANLLESLADTVAGEIDNCEPGCTKEAPCTECLRESERQDIKTALTGTDRLETFYQDLGGTKVKEDEDYPVKESSEIVGVVWSVFMEILQGEDLKGFFDEAEADFKALLEDEDEGLADYGKRIGSAFLGFTDRIFAPFLKIFYPRRYVYDYDETEQNKLEEMLSEDRIASSLRWIITPLQGLFTESKLAHFAPHPEEPGILISFPDAIVRSFLGSKADGGYDALGVLASPERLSVVGELMAEIRAAEELKELEAGYFTEDIFEEIPEFIENFVEKFNPERLQEGHPQHGNHIDLVTEINDMIDGIIEGMLQCPTCEGEGCKECKGTGKTIGDCLFCGGDGDIEGGICLNCNGTGETEIIFIGFDDWTDDMQGIASRLQETAGFMENVSDEETAVKVANIPARILGLFDEAEGAREALGDIMAANVSPVVNAVASGLQGEDLRNTMGNLVSDLTGTFINGLSEVVKDTLNDPEAKDYVTRTVTEIFTFGDLPGKINLILTDFLTDESWIGHLVTEDQYYHMCDPHETVLEPVPADAYHGYELGVNGGGLEYLLRLSLYYSCWYGHPDYEDITAYRALYTDGPARFYQATYREEMCDIDFYACEMGHAAYQGISAFFDLLMEWFRGEGLFSGDDSGNPRALQSPAKFFPQYFEDFFRQDFAGGLIPDLTDIILNVMNNTLTYQDAESGRGLDKIVANWFRALFFLRDDELDTGLIAKVGAILEKEYNSNELDYFSIPIQYSENPEKFEPNFSGLLKDVLIGFPDGGGIRDLKMFDGLASMLKYDPNDLEYPVPENPGEHPPVWMLKEHIGVTYAIIFKEIADFLIGGWGISEIVGIGVNAPRHFEFTVGLPVTPGTFTLSDGNLITEDKREPCGDCGECLANNTNACEYPRGYFINPVPGKEMVQNTPAYNTVNYDTGEVVLSINSTEAGADIVANWMPNLMGSLKFPIDPGQLRSALEMDDSMQAMLYRHLSGVFSDNITADVIDFLGAEEAVVNEKIVSRLFKIGYIIEDIPTRFTADIFSMKKEGNTAVMAEYSSTALSEHVGGAVINYEPGRRILKYMSDLVNSPTIFNVSTEMIFNTISNLYLTFVRRITSFGSFVVSGGAEIASGGGKKNIYLADADVSKDPESSDIAVSGPMQIKPAMVVEADTKELIEALQKALKRLDTAFLDEVLNELIHKERFDDSLEPLLETAVNILTDERLSDAVGGIIAANLTDGRLKNDIDFIYDIFFEFLYDNAVYEDVNRLLTNLLEDKDTEFYVDKVIDESLEIARLIIADAVRGIFLEFWPEDPADPGSERETFKILLKDFITETRRVLEGNEGQVGLEQQIYDMFTDEKFAGFLKYMSEMIFVNGLETWVRFLEDDRFKIVLYEILLEIIEYGFSGFEEIIVDPALTLSLVEGIDAGIKASGSHKGYSDGYAFLRDSVAGFFENLIYKNGYIADYFLNSFYTIMEEAPDRPAGGRYTAGDRITFGGSDNIVQMLAAELSVVPPDLIIKVFFDWLMFGGDDSPPTAGTFNTWGDAAAGTLTEELTTAIGAAYAAAQDYAVDFLYYEVACGECEICFAGGACKRKDEIMRRVVDDLYGYFFCPLEGEYDGIVEKIRDNPLMIDDKDHPAYLGSLYREITMQQEGINHDAENFQVNIKLDESNFDFSEARSDGFDIRFRDTDGKLLDFKRVFHDSIGKEAEYWVELPGVSRREDASFYIFYGNPDATDASTALTDVVFFSQSFEGTTFPPAGWARGSNDPERQWERSTDHSYDGNASAYIEWSEEVLNASLFTPWIEMGERSQLIFQEMAAFQFYDYYDEHFRIWVQRDDGRFTMIYAIEEDPLGWHEQIIDLSQYENEEIRVIFQYYGYYGPNWHIDNVLFTDAYGDSSFLSFGEPRDVYLPAELADSLVDIMPLEEIGSFLSIPVYFELMNQSFRDDDFPPEGWNRSLTQGDDYWELQTDVSRSGGASAGFIRTEPRVEEDNLMTSQDFDSIVWPPPRWSRWNHPDNIVPGWVKRSECLGGNFAASMLGTDNRTHLGDALRDEGYAHGEYDIHSKIFTPWFRVEDHGEDTYANLEFRHREGENDGRASLKKAEVRVEYYDNGVLKDELLRTFGTLPGSMTTVNEDLKNYAGKEIRIYFEFIGEGSLHSAWYQTSTRWYIYEWLLDYVAVRGNVEQRPVLADATLYTDWVKIEDSFVMEFHETSKENHSYMRHVVGIQDYSTMQIIHSEEMGRAPEYPQWRKQSIDLSEYAGHTVRVFFRYHGAGADSWYIDDFFIRTIEDYVDKYEVYNVLELWGHEAVDNLPMEEIIEDFLDGSCGECEGCLTGGKCENPTISGTLKEAFSGFTRDLLDVLIRSDIYHAFIDSIYGFPVGNITGFLQEEYDPVGEPGKTRADLIGENIPSTLFGMIADFVDYDAQRYPLDHGSIAEKRKSMVNFLYHSIIEILDEFGGGSPGDLAVKLLLEEMEPCGECEGCAVDELCQDNWIIGIIESLLRNIDSGGAESAEISSNSLHDIYGANNLHRFITVAWEESPGYFVNIINGLYNTVTGWFGISPVSFTGESSYSEFSGISIQGKNTDTLLSESFEDIIFPPALPDWERSTNVDGFEWERFTSHANTGNASAGIRHDSGGGGGSSEPEPAGSDYSDEPVGATSGLPQDDDNGDDLTKNTTDSSDEIADQSAGNFVSIQEVAPTGTISISDSGHYTGLNNFTVDLTLSRTSIDITQMRFRNGPTDSWSVWEAFSTSKSGWTLDTSTLQSFKTVQVQFRTSGGVILSPVSASFRLLFWNGIDYVAWVGNIIKSPNGGWNDPFYGITDDRIYINADGRSSWAVGGDCELSVVTDLQINMLYANKVKVFWMNTSIYNNEHDRSNFNLSTSKTGAGFSPVERFYAWGLRVDELPANSNGHVRIHARDGRTSNNSGGSRVSAYRVWLELHSPEIEQQPQDAEVYESETATFQTDATCKSGTTLSYQWQKSGDDGNSWSNISGATGKSYTTPVTVYPADDGFLFRCVVSNGSGAVAYSNTAKLTVKDGSPYVTSHPSDLMVKEGETGTFSVTPSGPEPFSYQWQRNDGGGWSNISGADKITYTTPATVFPDDNGLMFRCVVSNNFGNVTSNFATMTVYEEGDYYLVTLNHEVTEGFTNGDLSGLGGIISGGGLYAPGDPVTVIAETASGIGQDFLYWTGTLASPNRIFEFTMPGRDVNLMAEYRNNRLYWDGEEHASFPGGANQRGDEYEIREKRSDHLYLHSDSTGYTREVSWCSTAINLTGVTEVKTEWQGAASGSGTKEHFFTVATSANVLHDNGAVIRILSHSDGFTRRTESLDVSSLSGNHYISAHARTGWHLTATKHSYTYGYRIWIEQEIPDPPVNAPQVISHPANRTVEDGQDTTFSVFADGTLPFSYQWQRNDGSGWSNLTGETGDSYTLNSADYHDDNGAQFRCLVSNGGGNATSNTATLTVSPIPPYVVSQPSDQTVQDGQSAAFMVTAGGTGPFTYQWQRNDGSGWSNISGAEGSIYTTPATKYSDDNGLLFRCVVSSPGGNVDSNSATLTVEPVAPSFTSQPTNKEVDDGEGATFSITATGTDPLSYQWQRSDDSGDTWSDIVGATGDSYNTPVMVYPDDNGAMFRCVVSNVHPNNGISNPATLTVTAIPPSITSHPVDQMVGDGETATFSVTATGTAPLSYQWQHSADSGATWSNIAGATSDSYTTPPAVYPDDLGAMFRCVVSNNAGTAISNPATLTVTLTALPPSISFHPTNQTVNEGETATFTVSASGTAPLSYQWQRSDNGGGTWSVIDGVTGNSYTTPATVQANDDGAWFRCMVTNNEGSATSDAATLTVTVVVAPPEITAHPANRTVEEGQTATFNVTASGSAPLSHQWQRSDNEGLNWNDIGGADESSYTTPETVQANDNGAWFRCVVTNDHGSAISSEVTLTVYTVGEEYYTVTLAHAVTEGFTGGNLTGLGGIVGGEGQYAPGETVTVTAEAGGTGYDFLYWSGNMVSTDRIFEFTMPDHDVTIMAEYKNNRLYWYGEEHVPVVEGHIYSVDAPGEASIKYSNYLYKHTGEQRLYRPRRMWETLVKVDLTDVNSLVIDWQSTSHDHSWQWVFGNDFPKGDPYDNTDCLWMGEKDGNWNRVVNSWNIGAVGAATGEQYVGWGVGKGARAWPQGANYGELSVWRVWLDGVPHPPPPVIAPQITTNPANQTVQDGDIAFFSAEVSGTGPMTYQWQRSDNGGGSWSNIAGATGKSYITPATVYAADNGAQFRLVANNDGGTASSAAATLTVTPIPPTITANPANQTVEEGQIAFFSVTVSGSEPFSYQWQRSNDDGASWNNIGGATASSYTTLATVYADDNGAQFRCRVSNDGGNVTSGVAILTVTPISPSITSHPANQTVVDGQTADFSVTAAGSEPLSYQWQRSDDVGVSWINIGGATGSSYTMSATVHADDNGALFRCVVSNDGGSVNSGPATLTVTPLPPSITAHPEGLMVVYDQTADFSVTAAGTEPLSYQWQYSGDGGIIWSDIGGANESSYTTPPAVYPDDDGAKFRCVVSNDEGSAISDAATLTVSATAIPPEITSHPLSQTVEDGETASFSITATGSAPLSYQWQRSDNGGVGWSAIEGAIGNNYTTPATVHANDNGAMFRCVVTNAGGTDTSNAATLTVTPLPPFITAHPADRTVEEGQTATFNMTVTGTEPHSYQWQRSDNEGVTWSNIGGATGSSYTTPATVKADDDGAMFRCVVSNSEGSVTSNAANLMVYMVGEEYYMVTLSHAVTEGFTGGNLLGLGGIIGGDGQYAPGDTVTVTAEAGGAGYDFLYWSGDMVSTNRIFEFTMPNHDLTIMAEYQNNRLYWYGEEHVPIVEGHIYSVGAPGEASIKYSNYLYKHTGEQRTYRPRRMWETWVKIDLTDVNSLVIDWESTSHDHSWQWVFSNDVPKGDPYDGTTWRGEKEGNWSRVVNSWNIGAVGAATGEQYVGWGVGKGARVWPQGANYGELSVWRVWLDGVPHPDAPVVAPQITVHPTDQTVEDGQTALFSVDVAGTGPMTYQWQRSDDGGGSWQNVGVTYSTRYITDETVFAEDNGAIFRCVVSNEAGAITSNAATLTVISDPPVITSHPANQTVVEGETATFSVVADSGAPPDYQWQRSNDGGIGWINISGATSDSYTTPATVYANDDGAMFRCAVSNQSGAVTSDVALLTVLPVPPEITVHPNNVTIYDRETATFTVESSGTAPLSYQWQLSDDDGDNWFDISGATGAVFTTPQTLYLDDDGLMFRCVVSNAQGGDTSHAALLTVLPVPPVITVQPGDQTVNDGEMATFLIMQSGGTIPVSYQWQRFDGTWKDIPGEIRTVLTIPSVEYWADDGTLYRCRASNIAGSVNSNSALLTVLPVPPSITEHPVDETASEGSPAVFSVGVSGTPPMSYQWQRSDDVGISWGNIAGADESSYTTLPTFYETDHGALFRCVVSNAQGDVTTDAATLTVIPLINAYLYTPWVEINEEYRKAELEFMETGERQSEYTYHAVGVKDGENTYHLLEELGAAPEGSWEKITVDLSEFIGQTVRVYFHYQGVNADDWYIDDVAIKAYYDLFDLALVSSPAAGGTVTDNTSDAPYLKNELVNVTASANAGYRFINWTVDGVEVSVEETFNYIMPEEDVILTANFVRAYELVLSSNPEEGGIVQDNTGSGSYLAGEIVSVTATAGEGYQFVDWSVGGEMVSMEETFNFEMPAAHMVLTANFIDESIQLYLLTLEAQPSEGGIVRGSRLFEAGAIVTVEAEAATGYAFVNWTVDEDIVSDEATFEYEMPAQDTTMKANFEIIDYNLTIGAGLNGAVNPEGLLTRNYKDIISVEAIPGEGYGFVNWTANGSVVSTEASFEYVMAPEDVTLVANFGLLYELKLSADPAEWGTLSGGGMYTAGSKVKLTAEANEGYMFINWREDGTVRSTQSEFIYTMPAGNTTLIAIFIEEGMVYIPDEQLRKAIEYSLLKPGKEVTLANMQKLYSLSATERDIKDLTGLDFAGNLKHLDLFGNKIENLLPLEGLTELESLHISYGDITDIDFLKNLTSLEELDLSNNNITGIDALSGLVNLQRLNLGGNNISDLSLLSDLTGLKQLNLRNNDITSLESLESLAGLEHLNISGNLLNGIGALGELMNLRRLDISRTGINNTDITDLAGFGKLRSLYLAGNGLSDLSALNWSNLVELENLDLSDNAIVSLLPLKGINPVNLDLSSSQISGELLHLAGYTRIRDIDLSLCGLDENDFAALHNLTTLERLNLNGNGLVDISGLDFSFFPHLLYLYLGNNYIANLLPLAGLTLVELDLSYHNAADPAEKGLIENILPLQNVLFVDELWTLRAYFNIGKIIRFESLAFLDGLEGGGSLDLSNNQISDITPLAGKKLQALGLSRNYISDISPLSDIDLKGLIIKGILDLSGNWLTNDESLAVLESIRGVNVIDLSHNYLYINYRCMRPDRRRENVPEPGSCYCLEQDGIEEPYTCAWKLINNMERRGTFIPAEDLEQPDPQHQIVIASQSQGSPAERPQGVVRGFASGSGKESLAGAQVRAWKDDGDKTYETTTSRKGSFILPLPAGNYFVEVEIEGYSKHTVSNIKIANIGSSLKVQRVDVNFIMDLITFKGEIKGPSGEDLKNINISVIKDGISKDYAFGSNIFKIPAFPGNYKIEISSPGYLSMIKEIDVVEEGNDLGTLKMEYINLSGNVTDVIGKSLEEVSISALSDNLAQRLTAVSGKDGSFMIGDFNQLLKPGAYRLEIEKPGFISMKEMITVTCEEMIHLEETIKMEMLGDVLNTGSLDIADAIIALRHIVGLVTLEEDALNRAKISGGEKLSIRDVIIILRRIVGLSHEEVY